MVEKLVDLPDKPIVEYTPCLLPDQSHVLWGGNITYIEEIMASLSECNKKNELANKLNRRR